LIFAPPWPHRRPQSHTRRACDCRQLTCPAPPSAPARQSRNADWSAKVHNVSRIDHRRFLTSDEHSRFRPGARRLPLAELSPLGVRSILFADGRSLRNESTSAAVRRLPPGPAAPAGEHDEASRAKRKLRNGSDPSAHIAPALDRLDRASSFDYHCSTFFDVGRLMPGRLTGSATYPAISPP
jgi:hypothetical protein